MIDSLSALAGRVPGSLWDIIDIAIVAFLIYEFLKLIRGTRAAQMALGITLIVALFYVSRLAPLQTVNWLIRNMVGYVVFAGIVLFQADIRRALAHFGRGPFFRHLARDGDDDTIEEIVVAAAQLAAQRVGALVVLERAIGLRSHIRLDAALTYDLLISIFQSTSPLHDGAVVIQEDRVTAAACFLPLTVNPRLGRELGTRHRAAIGVSEESDAVAVVVSEETGQISLSLGGRIERDLRPDELRKRLQALVMRSQSGWEPVANLQ